MAERLAIDGGAPVRPQRLPYGRQTVDAADIAAVVDVLKSDWLTTGPAVDAYEAAVAAFAGAAHAVAVSSGTAALHAAMHAAGVERGREVVTTPLTFAATANSVLYCGGAPVFVDIDPDTLMLDPAAAEAAVTEKTRVIAAVDYAGQPADYGALVPLARRKGLVLIDDASHALGASCDGVPVGAIADITTFSTHPVKPITTGEGGVVVTNRGAYAQAARTFRNHGIAADARVREQRGDWHYAMETLGYNYRMPDILCALGLSQLAKLPAWQARRAAIAERYTAAFDGQPALEPYRPRPGRVSAWHLYPLRLHLDRLTTGRQQVFAALRAEGIGVNVHYIPVYWHPYYERLGYRRGMCPIAEQEYERLITLPLWPGMTDPDVADVIEAVLKVVTAYGVS